MIIDCFKQHPVAITPVALQAWYSPKDFVRYYTIFQCILKNNVEDSWNHSGNKCVKNCHHSDVIM